MAKIPHYLPKPEFDIRVTRARELLEQGMDFRNVCHALRREYPEKRHYVGHCALAAEILLKPEEEKPKHPADELAESETWRDRDPLL